jgi:hypothetical protein
MIPLPNASESPAGKAPGRCAEQTGHPLWTQPKAYAPDLYRSLAAPRRYRPSPATGARKAGIVSWPARLLVGAIMLVCTAYMIAIWIGVA